MLFFVCSFKVLFIFDRETQRERGRGREQETQNLKQAPGSEPSAQSLNAGLELMSREIMT